MNADKVRFKYNINAIPLLYKATSTVSYSPALALGGDTVTRKRNIRTPLTQARNLVRGAISILHAHSTPDARRDHWKQEQIAQAQINKALAIAKRNTSQREFADFEKWIGQFVTEQTSVRRQVGTHLTLLGILPNELEARSLSSELLIAADRIKRRETEILTFARDASALAELIEARDWEAVSTKLNMVRSRDGHSYWSIETELALTQSLRGIEAVKAKIDSMSICALGLNKFYLYFFGVRNEPAQTSTRFCASLKKKIGDSDLPPLWQAYAKFRLYGHLDRSAHSLASIIACEQLTTIVDLVFTLLTITRSILEQRETFSDEVLEATKKTCQTLAPITAALKISSSESECMAQTSEAHVQITLAQIADEALSLAFQPQDQWPTFSTSVRSLVIHGIASSLSTRSDGLPTESFAKERLNFRWLPLFMEVGDVSGLPSLPQLFLSVGQRPMDTRCAASIIGGLESAVSAAANKENDWPDALKQILLAMNEYRRGDVETAIIRLKNILNEGTFGGSRDIAGVLFATILQAEDRLEESLAICALIGMENERILPMLPLCELFQGVKWNSLRSYARSMDLAIALDHFLRVAEDRKARTFKRYTVEELMKVHECTISELPSALTAAGESASKIEYFFSQVCDIATLELLPGMGDSRKVWQARSKILRELAKLHTKAEPEYAREADEIDEDLQVDDGLFVLDDSKVYVDEQSILIAVNQELAGDFQRYMYLVHSGIGVSDSLSDVLKSFRNPSAKTFQIPKNDADDLLAELVQAILDRFLFDPASGLDIIVGRRIRHGTIASELRGYLEGFDLIGHKAHAGAEYSAPLASSESLARMDTKRRRIATAAFGRFSESIDQLISLLRDEYFHVRTKTKSRGIFDLSLHYVALALARSIAQTCENVDQFSKECIAIFWFFLSVRLDAQRPDIESDTKKTLLTIFSKLTNELRALGVTDLALLAHIQQASDELQHRASAIAGWIRVPKMISVEGRTYSLQQAVDVAGAVVTGQRPGFFPIVTSDVPESPQLDTHGFSIVTDALYIAFDNVCEHSGKKANNHVKVGIQFDASLSLLSFVITNEVTPNSRTTEREARINNATADIQKRVYGERARRDRHSGLAKLAALVMQSNKTSISFGYVEDDKFQLKFDLVYVGLKHSAPQVNSLLSDFEVGITIQSNPVK